MRRAMLTAAPRPDPLAGVNIGDAFMGGYFTGIIDTTKGNIIAADAYQSGQRYAVILAPKSLQAAKAYDTRYNISSPFCRTRWDGLSATLAMTDAAFIAAGYCSGLSYPSDGASQWYLPAMDELELVYRNLKPTSGQNDTRDQYYEAGSFPYTSAPKSGANPSSDPSRPIYTSTDPMVTSVAAFVGAAAQANSGTYWSATEFSGLYSWGQKMDSSPPGAQGSYSKSGVMNVRPVRRLSL